MLDLACSLVVLGAVTLVAAAYAARVLTRGRARSARADREGTSPLLPRGPTEGLYWALRGPSRACIALGIGADAVSWASLVLGLSTGLLAALGHFGAAAATAVLSLLGDALDGVVARASANASDAGEVLDAAIDRYVEFAMLAGLAVWFRTSVPLLTLALASLLASFMVSYSTAKAEALQVTPPRGAMRRAERAVYLLAGLTFAPIAAHTLPSDWAEAPIVAALLLIAVVGNASAIRRLASVRAQVRGR